MPNSQHCICAISISIFRFLFSIAIVAGCSNSQSTNKIPEQGHVRDSQHVEPSTKEIVMTSVKLFDNQRPFQIILSGYRIERNTSDKDTAKCKRWTLTTKQVNTIITNSKTIDGTAWDLMFDFLCCSIHGTIIQDNVEYPFTLNAGSYALINSGDTTIIYGDFKKADKRFFLSSPQE